MIDLNNPEMIGPYDPVANWKRALIVRLAKYCHLHTFIETGTAQGDTIEAVKDAFINIFSIELSSKLFNRASNRFKNDITVRIFHGSSGDSLETIVNMAPLPALFWLDAHGTSDDLPGNGDQTEEELTTIVDLAPHSLVLIDDVKPLGDGWTSPDAPIKVPTGWTVRFLHGVLILHAGGLRYLGIPEVF